MPVDTSLTRVRASATSGGTFTNIGYVTSYELTEGVENANKTLYFGGEIRSSGDVTVTGSFNLLFHRGDTLGQDLLRTAKRNGTTVFLQFCPEGTTTGAKCEQCEVYITEVGQTSDRSNDFVQSPVSFDGIASTLSTITLA